MIPDAPFALLALIQLCGIAGDILSQRCLRVVHRRSYRRFIATLSIVSCVQIAIVFGLMQLANPQLMAAVEKRITVDNDNNTNSSSSSSLSFIDVCENVTPMFDVHLPPLQDRCFAQGPLTMWRVFYACPFLLLSSVANVLVTLAFASLLLRSATGVVLCSVAAATASVMSPPLEDYYINNYYHHHGNSNNNKHEQTQKHFVEHFYTSDGRLLAGAIILGIVGAVACTFERSVSLRDQIIARRQRQQQRRAQRHEERMQRQQQLDATARPRSSNRRNITSAVAVATNNIAAGTAAAEFDDGGDQAGADDDYNGDDDDDDIVELIDDESASRMPINDENFRRRASDAPLTIADFVRRAAEDVDQYDAAIAAAAAAEEGDDPTSSSNSSQCCCACTSTLR